MRHPDHGAAARRDSKLHRIRKLTLWITGGAAAASLGLGTAFAHALPGHSHTTASGAPGRVAAGQHQSSVGTVSPGGRGATGSGATRHGGSSYRQNGRAGHVQSQHGRLTPPRQQPQQAAPAPAQAPVSSGGS
jgi:hypothetical protein